jgi:hypothetical protein
MRDGKAEGTLFLLYASLKCYTFVLHQEKKCLLYDLDKEMIDCSVFSVKVIYYQAM